MSSQNEFTYAKEFVGNLRAESEPVPVRVNTTIRITNGTSTGEVRQYSSREYDRAPRYIIGRPGELPLHPTLQTWAVGRHYFTW